YYCWGGYDWGEFALGNASLLKQALPSARPTVLPKYTQSLALGGDVGCALYEPSGELPSLVCFGDAALTGVGTSLPTATQARVGGGGGGAGDRVRGAPPPNGAPPLRAPTATLGTSPRAPCAHRAGTSIRRRCRAISARFPTAARGMRVAEGAHVGG